MENVVRKLEKITAKKKYYATKCWSVSNSLFFGIVSHIGNSVTEKFPSLACYKFTTKSEGTKEVKAGTGGTRRITEKKGERRKTEKGV